MIEKILKNYEDQQKEYLSALIKELDLDIPELVSVFPKSNYDLEQIFKKINLIEEDEDISEKLEIFYIDTLKRGILTSIPLGKTFMAKLHRDDKKHFDELVKKDSSLFIRYVPEIESLKDIADNIPNNKYKKDFFELSESKQIELIIESVLASFSEFTDDNEMMVEYHYEELFNVLDIDLKLAKKKCNKRVKLGPKSDLKLISLIFKEKKGKFRVTDLVKEHCKVLFEEGMRLGIRNGIKIVIDDIQSSRIKEDDFSNMSMNELSDYFYKEINLELEKRGC